MTRIILSSKARYDFVQMIAWIDQHNPRSATLARDDVLASFSPIARHPMANHSAKTSDKGDKRIKSLPKWHKVIIYKVETDRILIISIRDTRQELNE